MWENDDEWTLDADGKSNFCVISGEGGEIMTCETPACPNSFSVDLLKLWMENSEWDKLMADEDIPFHCFMERNQTKLT